MISIYTPDRAERLARSMEAQRLRVERLLTSEQPVVSWRQYGDLRIESRVYATVWKGNRLRTTITYEVISAGSVIW